MKTMVSTSPTGEATTIAVASSEMVLWGCPYCGYRSGYASVSGNGSSLWNCGECQKSCIILADGLTVSTIGLNGEYPTLQDHPRHGTHSHGRPDVQPVEGGEFFHVRGIGLEGNLFCFACGDRQGGLLNNIAAFVQNMTSGERIVAMFDAASSSARLDYRESEPDRVQVKVGACDEHLPNLENLATQCSDGRITSERIVAALAS